MTAPLATLPQHSPQPTRRLSQIPQHAEACTTVCVRTRHLPLSSSEQPPPSIPQIVALARIPSNSVSPCFRLRQLPFASPEARRSVQDTLRLQSVARRYWVKISAVHVSPRVLQVRMDLVAQSPHAQGLVGHPYQVVKRAGTRRSQTTHVHIQFPLPQFIMFLLRIFPQSTASTRGLRFANPTQRQYQRAPSRTGVLCRAPRDYSRWSALLDRQIALQIRAAFLAQHGHRSSLRHAGTEDSPYLSWEEMMRRRRSSMHGCAPSDDLEPGFRCSGAAVRRADGAKTRALPPPLRLSPQF